MSSINLSGNLLDPNGLFSVGDKVKFTHQTTTGETIKSAVSIIVIPPDGSYTLNLQYGIIKVEYRDVLTGIYKDVGIVTVNGDSTATTLPQLLNAIVPPTPPAGAVPEAPVNGKTYGRKDADWVEIVGGGMPAFKMQDATDAELNGGSNLDPSGYSYAPSPNGFNAQGGIELTPAFESFPVTLYVNKLDLDGKEPPIEYFNGAEVDIFLNEEFAYTKTIAVESYVPVPELSGDYVYLITWEGLIFQEYEAIKFLPKDAAQIPLKEGDAWVYDEEEQKFKPKPVVSTVVVTEFPAEPDANTLYIKVI